MVVVVEKGAADWMVVACVGVTCHHDVLTAVVVVVAVAAGVKYQLFPPFHLEAELEMEQVAVIGLVVHCMRHQCNLWCCCPF
jgi:hypothetical protein